MVLGSVYPLSQVHFDIQVLLEWCHVKELSQNVDPAHRFQSALFADQIRDYYAGAGDLLKGLGFIAFLAVLIAAFGLLAMVIYDIDTKTKEIGIRKVIGASGWDLIRSLSGSFSKILIFSVLISAPLIWIINSLILRSFAYRITLGPLPFLIGYGSLFSIGLFIILSQVLRAASRDPVETLRYE